MIPSNLAGDTTSLEGGPGAAPAQDSRLTVGDLTVDTQERNVYKNDVPVELVIYPREPHGLGEPRHQLPSDCAGRAGDEDPHASSSAVVHRRRGSGPGCDTLVA